MSASFCGFLYFYYKKTTKCDRLNVFIITFATLINKERNREYEQVLSTYSHIHVHDHDP
ncbi:signal recognition particle [Bacteroides oleiciplenus]|uniref:Signal recognition particle n=1 Tax=Bacteroides oleiciplenus TaxID=626931 RepID=A0A3E5BB07_9BACE|nr:signal recognition particle [Bacteroides oleiciplenus]